MGTDGFFGAVADTLLTTPNESAALHLPLHRAPQKIRGPLGYIGSMVQKAEVIGDRTLVLWAGPLIHAQRVLRRIEVVSDNGSLHVELKEICADLDINPHAVGLSLIHCFIFGDEVNFHCVNARGRSDPPFYYAGSGSEHFLNHIIPNITTTDNETKNDFLKQFISRILRAKLNEILNGDVFQHHYGGWFEIVEIVDGKFKKQPICLKIWEKSDKEYSITKWSPLWFSKYNGNDLHIAHILTHEHSEDIADLNIDVAIVSSLLHDETPRPDINKIKCESSIDMHVVVNMKSGAMRSLILQGHKPGEHFHWMRTEKGAQIALSPQLQTALSSCLDGI